MKRGPRPIIASRLPPLVALLFACSGMILARGARAQEQSPAPVPTLTAEQVTRLVQALEGDDSYKVRLQAAALLGRSGESQAVEPLVKALRKDPHYTVRAASAMALANLDYYEGVAEVLRALATDPEEFVREEAARALHKYNREEALPFVVAAYQSEDPRVRKVVVTYLAEESAATSEVILVRALGDNSDVVDVARGAIAKMDQQRRMRLLEDAVEHREAPVRRGAVDALRQLRNRQSAQIILKVFERDMEMPEVRDAARVALRDLRELLPLKEIVKDARSHADKYVRARALKLLGVVGGSDAQEALVETLSDQEIYIRGTAVLALRELGQPEAIPALEKLLRDPANQRIAPYVRGAVRHLRLQDGKN